MNSSGTSDSSTYVHIVETYRVGNETTPFTGVLTSKELESIEEVSNIFSGLAEDKAKKEDLPPRLNKINENLGNMFNIARQNYEKTNIDLGMVHQSAMDLRAVLQQLWGGLVALAREKRPATIKKHRFEMGKPGDRILIVECLIVNEVEKKKLISSLDIMANLYSDFSAGEFGKNILGNDKEKLKRLYKLWILTVNDIVNSVFSNIEFQD